MSKKQPKYELDPNVNEIPDNEQVTGAETDPDAGQASDEEPRDMAEADWNALHERAKSNTPFPEIKAGDVAAQVNFLRQEAVEALIQSGVIVDADNGDRPVFRDGHLAHLAREFNRMDQQGAWWLYRDDLTVATHFYQAEFEQLVREMAGE